MCRRPDGIQGRKYPIMIPDHNEMGVGQGHAVVRDSQASREETGMWSLAFFLLRAGDICHTVLSVGKRHKHISQTRDRHAWMASYSPVDLGLCLWSGGLLPSAQVHPNSLFPQTPSSLVSCQNPPSPAPSGQALAQTYYPPSQGPLCSLRALGTRRGARIRSPRSSTRLLAVPPSHRDAG